MERVEGPHGHDVDSHAEGRSLRVDTSLLKHPWCTRPCDSTHGDVVGLLSDRGAHDPEFLLQGLLGHDHLDNRGDHHRDAHLSCLSRMGDSPSSSHPELVGHQIACRGTGSPRRGPSVGWAVAPTHRVLGRRQVGKPELVSLGGRAARSGWEQDSNLLQEDTHRTLKIRLGDIWVTGGRRPGTVTFSSSRLVGRRLSISNPV